jgi:hypothetical protein
VIEPQSRIEAKDKGNQAAGTRLRNALQKLKVAATDLRQDILEKRDKK